MELIITSIGTIDLKNTSVSMQQNLILSVFHAITTVTTNALH